jgi:hypoxanthine phosphoribosyltransferase
MKNEITYKNYRFKKYISKESIDRQCQKIAKELNRLYKEKEIVFIGVLNGSFPFMSQLLSYITVNFTYDFIKISSYEGTESKELKMHLDLNKDIIINKEVVVIEDIVDSGKTIKFVKNKIEKLKPISLNVGSLLVKSDVIEIIDWHGFVIDDKFVIGYGLDIDNKHRNLKDIYIKIEE